MIWLECNPRLVFTSESICLVDFVFESCQNFVSNFALFWSFFSLRKSGISRAMIPSVSLGGMEGDFFAW
jgi:hypothetical protein